VTANCQAGTSGLTRVQTFSRWNTTPTSRLLRNRFPWSNGVSVILTDRGRPKRSASRFHFVSGTCWTLPGFGAPPFLGVGPDLLLLLRGSLRFLVVLICSSRVQRGVGRQRTVMTFSSGAYDPNPGKTWKMRVPPKNFGGTVGGYAISAAIARMGSP